MIKRDKLLIGAGVAIWVILGVLLVHHLSHHPAAQPKKVKTDVPCSTNADPCIKITQQDGAIYRLNDFRFYSTGNPPQKCIAFVSLPDAKPRTTCGDYHLDWIGPDGSKRGTDV